MLVVLPIHPGGPCYVRIAPAHARQPRARQPRALPTSHVCATSLRLTHRLYMRAGMDFALASDEEIATELAKERRLLAEAMEKKLQADVALLEAEAKVEFHQEEIDELEQEQEERAARGGASRCMSASHMRIAREGTGRRAGRSRDRSESPDAIAAVVSMCVVSVVGVHVPCTCDCSRLGRVAAPLVAPIRVIRALRALVARSRRVRRYCNVRHTFLRRYQSRHDIVIRRTDRTRVARARDPPAAAPHGAVSQSDHASRTLNPA